MTNPRRFLLRMVLFLIAVLAVAFFLFEPLQGAFMANAPLNGLIIGVLVLGVIYNFRQVIMLYPEVSWIENFRQNGQATSQGSQPRLLASMATMLGERNRDHLSLSALSMRSLLDGIYSRLDESRDLSRYTIGLLIFLGLLGTFWGLLGTVASIGNVIANLSINAETAAVFADLKDGLQAPMTGMGTAFSSSLFGLAGSLVLGFLDLQAGQALNRFYNDLEEWLSSLTRLSSGALSASGEGDQSVPAYVQALLEQTAESLESLQRTIGKGEESRISANNTLMAVGEKMGTLSDHMRTEQALMMKLAESQLEMKPILARLAENSGSLGGSSGGLDEATRSHIRNLDVYMARLVEELGSGREDIISQIRSEIKLLARTIAATKDG
ncbi:MAG: flagellar motor protein MotA [Rhodospirillaceae bacterium]|nr:flagellar motor protein MotA [Rhodospirillaceae bacterium]MBL6942151.1 flagellar motor protein MotA [Rhodospirillales bacterium]